MKQRIKFYVPIFDVSVAVIVTTDIPDAYRREFGTQIEDLRMACLGYEGKRHCLFFEPTAVIRPEIVAHEVFHLTHRILERCCMNFDPGHHEVGAYLNEWLTKQVGNALAKMQKHRKPKRKKRS